MLFGALHGFWKRWALQGMQVNKKSRLLKVNHFFFSFSMCGEVFDQLDGE
jgi:hypothetical protein